MITFRDKTIAIDGVYLKLEVIRIGDSVMVEVEGSDYHTGMKVMSCIDLKAENAE